MTFWKTVGAVITGLLIYHIPVILVLSTLIAVGYK